MNIARRRASRKSFSWSRRINGVEFRFSWEVIRLPGGAYSHHCNVHRGMLMHPIHQFSWVTENV